MVGGSVRVPVFIGRGPELEVARAALRATAAGTPAHLLVAGEAGVGKSRFFSEIGREARASGFRVASGGSVPVGQAGLPYGPIAEVLRSLARDVDGPTLRRAAGRSAAELARLVPEFLDTEAGPAERTRDDWAHATLFDALAGFLRRLAVDQPLFVVIEDVHWADPATRDAMTFLLSTLRADPVLLGLSIRSDELHRRHPALPWLAEIERAGRLRRIDLQRFDELETAAFLAALGTRRRSLEWAGRIFRRSDGNAFFIESLVMSSEPGGTEQKLPATLREVLDARISAAPDHAQRLLRIAAVAGRRVDDALLERLAGMSSDDLEEALRAAIAADLLVVDDDGVSSGYAFRHALLQEAVYDEVLPSERRRLHRAVAEVLEARLDAGGMHDAARLAEIAHHWASARVDDHAAVASVRAGAAAKGSFAFMSALTEYVRATELWDRLTEPERLLGMDRLALLEVAADAGDLCGSWVQSEALRRECVALAKSIGDRVREGISLERLGRTLWLSGTTDASLAAYDEAESLLDASTPNAARARVLSGKGQILMLVDRYDASIELCQEAVMIARSIGDRAIESHALNTMGSCLAYMGRCAEGIEALETSLAIAEELRLAADIGRAYVNLVDALPQCGRDADAIATAEAGLRRAEELGITHSYGFAVACGASLVSFHVGNWAEADRYAQIAAQWQLPSNRFEITSRAYTIELVAATAPEPDARRALERLDELLSDRTVEGQFLEPYCVAASDLACWEGRPELARPIVDRGVEGLRNANARYFASHIRRVGARVEADIAVRARARRRLGDAHAALATARAHAVAARAIVDDLPLELRLRGPSVAASVTADAEVTRANGASDPDAWRLAAAAWTDVTRPYNAAYSRWREAEACLEHGDRADARQALRQADAVARPLGARHLIAAIEMLARRARIDLVADVAGPNVPQDEVSRPELADPYGLTSREREVLALVADGRTNREIAATLFISENTAGVHVSRILGKLGVAHRAEAAALAVRLDLRRQPGQAS